MFNSIFWVAVFSYEFLMDEFSPTFLLFLVCFTRYSGLYIVLGIIKYNKFNG